MRSILVAIAILIIPVLAYLWLQTGKNHYVRLPYFGEKTVSGPLRTLRHQTFRDTIFHRVSHFTLQDQNGKVFDSDRLKGHIFICNFFYTHCPDVCKAVHNGMDSLTRVFKIHPEIKFLSISVDGLADTPEVLKKYALGRHADTTRWFFLRGTTESVQKLAKTDFLLDAAGLEHSNMLCLCDGSSHIRGFYDGTQDKEVRRLMDELIVLRLEEMRTQIHEVDKGQ